MGNGKAWDGIGGGSSLYLEHFCVALLCFAMISYGVLDERAGIMLAYPREGLSYMHVLESLAFAFVWLFYF